MKSAIDCWAIVPAAGIGSRMQATIPKQYLSLEGRPLIEHSLLRLLETRWIKGIVVAIAEDDQHWPQLSLSKHPKIKTVTGGAERIDSVSNALNAIQDQLLKNDFILVHDAARPCLSHEDLERLFDALVLTDSGVVLADKISDTVKRDDGNSAVLKTVPRQGLWRAFTPQIFPHQLLTKALNQVKNDLTSNITDEASAIEQLGLSPALVQGRSDNIKITTTGDIHLASLILRAQREQKR